MDCARRNKVGCYTVARDVAEPTKNKYLNFAIIAAETESSIILSEYPVAKKKSTPPHFLVLLYTFSTGRFPAPVYGVDPGPRSANQLRWSTAATDSFGELIVIRFFIRRAVTNRREPREIFTTSRRCCVA